MTRYTTHGTRTYTGKLEAWDWMNLGEVKGGVAITEENCKNDLLYVEMTPKQMVNLARRLLNVASELEERGA